MKLDTLLNICEKLGRGALRQEFGIQFHSQNAILVWLVTLHPHGGNTGLTAIAF
jgi:hypothetical protein